MKEMNSVQIVGVLPEKPVLSKANSGTSYCAFVVRIDESYTKNKEKVRRLNDIRCIMFGDTAHSFSISACADDIVYLNGKINSTMNEKGYTNITIIINSYLVSTASRSFVKPGKSDSSSSHVGEDEDIPF